MKPWEKYAQPAVSTKVTKPWEKFQEKKEPNWIKKAGINLLETGRAFVDPLQAFKGGMVLGKEVVPQIPRALRQAIPYKSVVTGKYDIEGLKRLREQMPQEIGHPLEAIKEGKLASTAATWYAPWKAFKGGVKGILKGKAGIGKTEAISELIGGKLERSTVENVAQNPYVQKGMSMFAKEDMNEVVNSAAEATMKAKENISNAQNYIYKKAGITDEMLMPSVKVEEALTNIKTEVDKFSRIAIGENKKLAIEAKELINDLEKQRASTGEINFGQIKSLTRQIYDLADANVTDTGRHTEAGRLYKQIGAELTKVKKSVLPIAEAGEKYSQLMEAESVLRDTLRLDRITGEQTLPLKIIRRFKDAEHGQFKKQLENANDIIKKNADIFKENPETADMINEYGNADFVDKIKLTQALHDVTTKRAVTPTGVGRIPGLAYLIRGAKVGDPMAQMVMLKKAIQSGLIRPELVSKQIPVSESLIGGRTVSKLRALEELAGVPTQKPWAASFLTTVRPKKEKK